MKGKYPNRLKEFMDRKGLGPTALAREARTSKQNVSRFADQERELTPEWARRFAPHLDASPHELVFVESTTDTVPLLSWISAGSMMREDVSDEALGTVTVTDLPAGDWIALKVVGDSMDRISPPESIIFVDRQDRELVPNALYIIADEDGTATYKRYRPGPPMRFEPVSVNSAHEPIFPAQEPLIVGRVKRSMIDT